MLHLTVELEQVLQPRSYYVLYLCYVPRPCAPLAEGAYMDYAHSMSRTRRPVRALQHSDSCFSRPIGVRSSLIWTHRIASYRILLCMYKAERKKAAMRKAARARILGKRAAAAAKQARVGAAGGRGGAGRGGKARVFRRAKRDCRVMDARRKKLGAYLFCGKGTPV